MNMRRTLPTRGADRSHRRLGGALAACSPKPSEIRVTPAKTTLFGPGHTQWLKYEVFDKKGNPMPGLTAVWASDKPKIASVDANGLVRSVGPGRATVTATFQTLTSSASVDVIDVAVPHGHARAHDAHRRDGHENGARRRGPGREGKPLSP